MEATQESSPNCPLELEREDWGFVAKRVKKEIFDDNISIVAGGVAFWGFLAVFPAIAAGVSLWGIFGSKADVKRLGDFLGLPNAARQLLTDQADLLASSSGSTLGLGSAFAFLLALWSANKGTKAVIQAIHLAYGVEEERSFLRLNLFTLAVTLSILIGFLVFALALFLVPLGLQVIHLDSPVGSALGILRWPILYITMLVAMAVVYRYALAKHRPGWRWVSPGSLVGGTLWVVGALGFSIYVEHFANYSRSYGSLGAVVVLMMWFFITAYVLLLGAEINSEVERHRDKLQNQRDNKPPRGASPQ
tara:strand:- start:21620 stop:22534 length:915 start_codon:yes stop_codon:yes gene_type:complete